VLCLGAGTVTVTPAAGVTINGTPLTLATSKGGSLVRTASNVWTFIPFSGGVEAANFTNTATGTYTDSDSVDWKYLTFTGSGSLVISQAGECKVLILGGGGGGKLGGWSGRGGASVRGTWPIAADTYAVTIGAGGPGNTTYASSSSGGITSVGTTFEGFGGGAGAVGADGFDDDITGSTVTYATSADASPTVNKGEGGHQTGNQAGSSGVVVIAVRV